MDPITIGLLGSSLLGGIFSGRGASNATEAQVDASNDNIEFQQGIYDQQQELFDPFYQSGLNALAAYNYEMGLGPMPGQQGSQQQRSMLGGSGQPSSMFNTASGVAGQMGMPNSSQMGGQTPGFQYQGFQATPGYQFALDQGNQQIQGSAAAQGNVLSGATMQSLQNHGIGMANQEYGNYMNQLSGLAGAGQAAAGQTASAAGNLGMATGQAFGNIGNAQAAGSVAMGNVVNNSLGNALSSYGYLNTVNPGTVG